MSHLSLKGEFAERSVQNLLLLSEGKGSGLRRGNSAAHSTGSTGSKIYGLLLLLLKSLSDLTAQEGCVDSQKLGNLSLDDAAVLLGLISTTFSTYILPSLLLAVPDTTAIRRSVSSCLSCLTRSAISALSCWRISLRFKRVSLVLAGQWLAWWVYMSTHTHLSIG